MKKYIFSLASSFLIVQLSAQVNPAFLRLEVKDSDSIKLNMDATYNRPFLRSEKLPITIGGHAEVNYQYLQEDGINEGHQFQMRRTSLFISTSIANRFSFLSEIEFEDGAKEINIEFAALDFEISPLLIMRAGIVVNPIGAFNQNHDGPKWDFVDRPISATQLLPATFSNVGFGIYGKNSNQNWAYGYEFYLTNGLNDRLIANEESKTFLPAVKADANRFEESFNGSLLTTAKFTVRKNAIGELGLSWMGGNYNKYQEDGFKLDKRRRADVFAVDFNTKISKINTTITSEWAWIKVNIPETYTEQFGENQQGGVVDFVTPLFRCKIFGIEKSILNAGLRVEYVDWNKGKFKTTNGNIAEDVFSIVPAISWRPTAETVFRINYRYNWQRDILGNPPAKMAGIQIGVATYF